jgi:aryl-alcohol dehydrogenase-like predicted oxidoreductase
MIYRTLGHSSLQVSGIAFGSSRFGRGPEREAIQLFQRALDMGINFIDTADEYVDGRCEELIGQAIAGRREQVVLASKFGFVKVPGSSEPSVDGTPEHVVRACEASLRRLGQEVIDLYYLHRVDPNVPIEETVGAMGRLVEQGKVRYLGLSEAAPATIRRAHAVHPISAVETEYSLLYRSDAEATLPTTRELGISFVAYSPLGRGLLTGAIRELSDLPPEDTRRNYPRFYSENLAGNRALVVRIEEIAREMDVTPGQLGLAWLLAQGDDVVVVPGTGNAEHLDENLGALAVELDAKILHRLGQALPPGSASGARLPEEPMRKVQL